MEAEISGLAKAESEVEGGLLQHLAFQMNRVKAMAEECDYKHMEAFSLEPLKTVVKGVVEKGLNYRDVPVVSKYTGKLAPEPKVPFMENFDDSLEAFKKLYVDE